MDYKVTETTLNDPTEACERQMSTIEIVREIRKELSETISVLDNIRLSLEGTETPERKTDEPKCFYEEVLTIEHIAFNCMGLAHVIADKLFGSMTL